MTSIVMPCPNTNDLRLLAFLYKGCRSFKYYPHILVALEDMGSCGLSEKEIRTSMDRLNFLNVYYPADDEYVPLSGNTLSRPSRRRNGKRTRRSRAYSSTSS